MPAITGRGSLGPWAAGPTIAGRAHAWEMVDVSGKRLLIPGAVLSLALAACGGSSPTQAPNTGGGGGTATDTPAEVTDAPAATQSGGGGGNGGSKPAGWDQYGKVHIEISGPASHTGDYGFIPAGSIFGGDQGSSLNFTVEGTDTIVSIVIGADDTVLISFGSPELSAPAAECTTSDWNIGASSASGSFDCEAAMVITASGAMLAGAHVKGSFDARAS